MKLSGNTILITGGTSGIGYELGKALLELENTVILLGRNEKKLASAEKLGFHTLKCDLRHTDEIEDAVLNLQNRYPKLNVLINNAGIQHNESFAGTVIPLSRISEEIHINTTAQLVLTHLLIPMLSTRENPFIINTTSALGAFPKSSGIVYSASKAAMRNFTLGLRYALPSTGIKVLEFIPPVTDTGMTANREEKKMDVSRLISKVLPQMRKEKAVITVPTVRLFLWISFLFPRLANRMLD
jgi:uncharacterized oxidoreductase